MPDRFKQCDLDGRRGPSRGSYIRGYSLGLRCEDVAATGMSEPAEETCPAFGIRLRLDVGVFGAAREFDKFPFGHLTLITSRAPAAGDRADAWRSSRAARPGCQSDNTEYTYWV